MPFVKLEKSYVNIDHIALVEDSGPTWRVIIDIPYEEKSKAVYVEKKSSEGERLIKALESHSA